MSVITVTRQISERALNILRKDHEVHIWEEDRPMPRMNLLRAVAESEGLLCMLTDKIDEALLDSAPKLRTVSQLAVGFDNVDLAACTARKIPVGHTPGVLSEAVADLTFALILATARRVIEGARYVRSGLWGTWSPGLLLGHDVYGSKLGIIGLGRIGQAVARRAAGFNMKIMYHGGRDSDAARALNAEPRSMEALLRESDFVSLHVPLTPATQHLIGARELEMMKATAVLINTARGPLIDQKALYEALKEQKIFAAALDVTDPEPIHVDEPILQLDNCVIVPHIGSASVRTREAMGILAAKNLVAALNGEPMLHTANQEVYL